MDLAAVHDEPPMVSLSPVRDPSDLRLDAVADPASLADDWRALERDGLVAPFQTFAWVETWIAADAVPAGARPLLLRLRRVDATVGLLPLVVERTGPLAVARRLGGNHASYFVGAWAEAALAGLDPARLAAAFRTFGRTEGIDAFALDAVPATWDDRPNPLAVLGRARPSLDDGHVFRLAPSFEALLAGRNAAHKRKKLKAKERLLAAAGTVRVAVAATPAEVEAALAAFFAQKAASLAARGLDDPFAAPAVRDAFRRLALASLGAAFPLLELTSLEVGGRIRAVIGAATHRGRLFALFASHADDDLARASPGETLFFRHIEAACGHGLAAYDMGVGRERYKESWCDERVALLDLRLPVTVLGRLFVAVEAVLGGGKAAIRRNRRFWEVVRRWRARIVGRSAGQGDRADG